MLWGILIVLGFAGGAFVVWKKSQSKDQPKALPRSRSLTNLKLNDIVIYLDQNFMVEGKLVYSEDGDEWYEYRLVDGDDVMWLSVEDDDELEAGLYREVDDLNFTSKPPETIMYNGTSYRLDEWGRAKVTKHGRTGKKSAGSVTYYEYEAPGGMYLAVEQWGEGSFEVSEGSEVNPSVLEILPGDAVDDGDYL